MAPDGRFDKRQNLLLLLTFCALLLFDWMLLVDSITVTSNSDSNKVKREDNVKNFRENKAKTFFPSQPAPTSERANIYQQKDKGIKNRLTIYNNQDRDRDNSLAGTGYESGEQYGLYAPDEQAYQGYGYQDFDKTPHYGPPEPTSLSGDRGGYHVYSDEIYKDHREQYPTFGYPQYKPDPTHALKGLILPLAGVALLGAAAALATNPVLLQLGVLSGGRRRRRSVDDHLDADGIPIDNKEEFQNRFRAPNIRHIVNSPRTVREQTLENQDSNNLLNLIKGKINLNGYSIDENGRIIIDEANRRNKRNPETTDDDRKSIKIVHNRTNDSGFSNGEDKKEDIDYVNKRIKRDVKQKNADKKSIRIIDKKVNESGFSIDGSGYSGIKSKLLIDEDGESKTNDTNKENKRDVKPKNDETDDENVKFVFPVDITNRGKSGIKRGNRGFKGTNNDYDDVQHVDFKFINIL